MKVLLTYFKPTGKNYTSGEYETTCEHVFEILNEVRRMAHARELPGLIVGHSDFYVLVDPVGHPQGFKSLVIPQSLEVSP